MVLVGSGRRTQGAGLQGIRAEGSRRAGREGSGQMEEIAGYEIKAENRCYSGFLFYLLPLFAVMWLVLDRLTDSPVPVGIH